MKQFPSAEWIWWLDMDAVVMNPWIDLEERLLSPDGMQARLLNGSKILGNERIRKVEGEETPELIIEEVNLLSLPSLLDLSFVAI
jgi:hypothetical protein